MKNLEKFIFLFLLGGFGYGLLEIAFRGFTHWSMIITGGSALIALYLINKTFPTSSIYIKSLAGCLIITLLELTVGIVVNKFFSFGVWDYTESPANFLGVISLKFSFCWFTISFVILFIMTGLQKITKWQKA